MKLGYYLFASATILTVAEVSADVPHNNIIGEHLFGTDGDSMLGSTSTITSTGTDSSSSLASDAATAAVFDMIPDHVLDMFKSSHGIKADYELDLQYLYLNLAGDGQQDGEGTTTTTPTPTLMLPDGVTSVTLDQLEPEIVFSSGCECFKEDVLVPCPTMEESTVYSQYTPDNSQKIQVNYNGKGDVQSITVRSISGGHPPITFEAVSDGIVTHIPDEALDEAYWSRFKMKNENRHGDNDDGRVRNLRKTVDKKIKQEQAKMEKAESDYKSLDKAVVSTKDDATLTASENGQPQQQKRRKLCDSFREIEVAIAVESSFCDDVGAANAQGVVESIMADVSAEYEMDGLCFKATIVHYEEVSLLSICIVLVYVSQF